MKFLESFDSYKKIGYGTRASVYDDNEYVIRVENTSIKTFNYIKNRYDLILGKDLKHVVKIYNISYKNGYTIIKMEKLYNPEFTTYQNNIITNFISLIEYKDNDFENASKKTENKYNLELDNDIYLKKILSDIYTGYIELTDLDIYHCDMKPDNIMIDKNDNYKIIDIYSA